MKGCASLLGAMVVLALLAGGGYLLYTELKETKSGPPRLNVENQTAHALTLRLTREGRVVSFKVAPGAKQSQELTAGTWEVEGSIAEAQTRRFRASWTLEQGQEYGSTFTREGGEGDGQIGWRLLEATQP